jgi:prepilin-type N-terminal cleavage/methylation domain-containing protein
MRTRFLQRDVGKRRGVTLMETLAALAVLGVAMLTLSQIAYLSLCERQRNAAREGAVEAAANLLEAARACSWEDLTPAWAEQQRLPEALSRRMRDGRLEIRVEPEASLPHTRRITVAIHWLLDDGKPARPVQLVALRSARTSAAGGTPR